MVNASAKSGETALVKGEIYRQLFPLARQPRMCNLEELVVGEVVVQSHSLGRYV